MGVIVEEWEDKRDSALVKTGAGAELVKTV